ncbi:MAG: hypothetical protein ACRDOO_28285 [Actinomadura sp.]
MSDPQAWVTPGVSTPGVTSGARLPEGPPQPPPPVLDRSELLGGDIPLRPLGSSEILDGAITTIRRNPRAVLGLSLMITVVVQVLITIGAYYFIGDRAGDEVTPTPVLRTLGAQFTLSVVGLMLSAFGVLLLAGLLAPVIGRTMLGLPASLRQTWHDTRPQLPRLAGASLTVMAISLLAVGLPLAPFVLFAATDAPPVLGVLSGVVGAPLGLALMLWLYVLFVLAAPAVVMERLGVLAALRRAHQLVRRRWWRASGTLMITLVIAVFMGFLALRVPFLIVQYSVFGEDPTGTALVLSLAVDTFGRIVSWALIIPFDAGVITLLYIDQRMRREGFDLELQTRPRTADDFLELWRPSPLVPRPGAGRAE